MDYNQLEEEYKKFRELQKQYFSQRYKYWNAIAMMKHSVVRTDGLTYKQYEGQVRRQTKKIRRELLKSKPRGKNNLDHILPVLKAWSLNWTVDQCCERRNLQWMSRKDNQWKGILDESQINVED